MSMDINTNIDALNALRNLGTTSTAFASSVQKLSSGLRINTAADDAAGLAIATKLQSQVTGLNQAQRNAQDGVSMVQTAEGALNEVQTMLQRIRELSVEAANSTLGPSDAASVNAEITALQAEINRTAKSTTFNGQNLLTGDLSVAQSGGTVGAGFAVTGTDTSVTAVNVSGAKSGTTYSLSADGDVLTLSDGAANPTTQSITLDDIAKNGSQTINFANLGVSITVSSVSGAAAADVATGLDKGTIETGSGTGAVFQVGANEGDTIGVAFNDVQTSALTGLDAAIKAFSDDGSTVNAGKLITATDAAIAQVSGYNSDYGAVENRLNDTVATLSVTSQNLTASESRIKDLDVAAEMVNFTKTQILQQAGTAILAQANSAPQSILTLLR